MPFWRDIVSELYFWLSLSFDNKVYIQRIVKNYPLKGLFEGLEGHKKHNYNQTKTRPRPWPISGQKMAIVTQKARFWIGLWNANWFYAFLRSRNDYIEDSRFRRMWKQYSFFFFWAIC